MYQGTGLGLSISKNLVKLMDGGTIKIESEYGRGSKFYFTVPLKVDTSNFLTTQGIKEINTQKSNVNSKYSILCVDDELVNRIIYKKRLEKLNYNIELAEDGMDAIKKVEEATTQGKSFDMIFMDINMPKLDGIEAMKKLREKGYKIPIIAVTGYALPEQIKESIDGGMSNVLTKPYETESLLKMINQYLKN
jgi:CheY-like chemotaxis protein